MLLEDDYIDLRGFLEGDSNTPFRWQKTSLLKEPKPEEWLSVEYFQIRAREFLQNIEDLKLPQILSLDIDNHPKKSAVFTSCYPGRHRAKSVYLDFRHFVAVKEPSFFTRTISSVRKNLSQNEPVNLFLRDLKHQFHQETKISIIKDSKLASVDKLLNVWFNTQYFHAGTMDQIRDRRTILMRLEEEGAEHLLFWAVVNAAYPIKALYACVKDLRRVHAVELNAPDPLLIT